MCFISLRFIINYYNVTLWAWHVKFLINTLKTCAVSRLSKKLKDPIAQLFQNINKKKTIFLW